MLDASGNHCDGYEAQLCGLIEFPLLRIPKLLKEPFGFWQACRFRQCLEFALNCQEVRSRSRSIWVTRYTPPRMA